MVVAITAPVGRAAKVTTLIRERNEVSCIPSPIAIRTDAVVGQRDLVFNVMVFYDHPPLVFDAVRLSYHNEETAVFIFSS